MTVDIQVGEPRCHRGCILIPVTVDGIKGVFAQGPTAELKGFCDDAVCHITESSDGDACAMPWTVVQALNKHDAEAWVKWSRLSLAAVEAAEQAGVIPTEGE